MAVLSRAGSKMGRKEALMARPRGHHSWDGPKVVLSSYCFMLGDVQREEEGQALSGAGQEECISFPWPL